MDRQSDYEDACRRGLEIVQTHLKVEPDDPRAWYLGAQAHCGLGNRDTALEWIEHVLSKFPEDTATSYNAACVYSELGMIDDVIECFRRAIFNGFSHKDWITNDPYFDSVRDDPRFIDIVNEI